MDRFIDANTWHADGLLSLIDIERAIGLKVHAELDANTLSGLFMQRLSRMPEVGDTITEDELSLTVESLIENRVGQVLIERLDDDSSVDNLAFEDFMSHHELHRSHRMGWLRT